MHPGDETTVVVDGLRRDVSRGRQVAFDGIEITEQPVGQDAQPHVERLRPVLDGYRVQRGPGGGGIASQDVVPRQSLPPSGGGTGLVGVALVQLQPALHPGEVSGVRGRRDQVLERRLGKVVRDGWRGRDGEQIGTHPVQPQQPARMPDRAQERVAPLVEHVEALAVGQRLGHQPVPVRLHPGQLQAEQCSGQVGPGEGHVRQLPVDRLLPHLKAGADPADRDTVRLGGYVARREQRVDQPPPAGLIGVAQPHRARQQPHGELEVLLFPGEPAGRGVLFGSRGGAVRFEQEPAQPPGPYLDHAPLGVGTLLADQPDRGLDLGKGVRRSVHRPVQHAEEIVQCRVVGRADAYAARHALVQLVVRHPGEEPRQPSVDLDEVFTGLHDGLEPQERQTLVIRVPAQPGICRGLGLVVPVVSEEHARSRLRDRGGVRRALLRLVHRLQRCGPLTGLKQHEGLHRVQVRRRLARGRGYRLKPVQRFRRFADLLVHPGQAQVDRLDQAGPAGRGRRFRTQPRVFGRPRLAQAEPAVAEQDQELGIAVNQVGRIVQEGGCTARVTQDQVGLNREGQQAATHGDGPVGTGDEAGPVRRRHLLGRGPQQRRARQRVESPQRGQRRRRRTGRKLQGGFQRGLRIADDEQLVEQGAGEQLDRLVLRLRQRLP